MSWSAICLPLSTGNCNGLEVENRTMTDKKIIAKKESSTQPSTELIFIKELTRTKNSFIQCCHCCLLYLKVNVPHYCSSNEISIPRLIRQNSTYENLSLSCVNKANEGKRCRLNSCTTFKMVGNTVFVRHGCIVNQLQKEVNRRTQLE